MKRKSLAVISTATVVGVAVKHWGGVSRLDDIEKLVAEEKVAEERLAEAIGVFVMRFGFLERNLNWSLWCLLGLNERVGEVLTTTYRNVSAKLDLYFALTNGRRMADEVRRRLIECGEEIALLNTYRNRLLHNQFSSHQPVSDTWLKFWVETANKKARCRHVQLNPSDIRAEAEKCFQCVVRLMDGIKAYQNATPLEKL